MSAVDAPPQSPSECAYATLRSGLLDGSYKPGSPLKPAALASEMRVSLTVVREALAFLSGEGLIERRTNRGFVVPQYAPERWHEVVATRMAIEPVALTLAIEAGDLGWESDVLAAQHRLAGTPTGPSDRPGFSAEWHSAHATFHRSLLAGCGNAVLIETTDRLWLESELYRRWSAAQESGRDFIREHAQLADAAIRRDALTAASLLRDHIKRTLDDLEEGL